MTITTEDVKRLIEKYPYLIPRSVWTGKVFEDYEYDHIVGHYELPDGWTRLFLLYCKDLKPYLEAANYTDKFMFSQIKEKWGLMELYNFGAPAASHDLTMLYTHYSKYVCPRCGKPTSYYTKGWTTYLCKACAKEAKRYTTPKRMFRKPLKFKTTLYSNGKKSHPVYNMKTIHEKYMHCLNMYDEQFIEYILEA